MDLFGDRWSILIIRDVMNGVGRFDDLVRRLEISRATLADRLRRLVAAGILINGDLNDPGLHEVDLANGWVLTEGPMGLNTATFATFADRLGGGCLPTETLAAKFTRIAGDINEKPRAHDATRCRCRP